jgi:hypothetical protein
MIKINFCTIAVMSIFVAACSQTNPSESKTVTPTIDKLPAEFVLFEGEKIIDVGDLDGDFKGDAFAFCTKKDLPAGFLVYLSKSDKYTYSEFEELDGWGEPMTRKVTHQNNSIFIEAMGLYVFDKVEIKYDSSTKELYFEKFEYEYSTRDHEVYNEGVFYLSSGQYVGNKDGKELSVHPSRIKIEDSKSLLGMNNDN